MASGSTLPSSARSPATYNLGERPSTMVADWLSLQLPAKSPTASSWASLYDSTVWVYVTTIFTRRSLLNAWESRNETSLHLHRHDHPHTSPCSHRPLGDSYSPPHATGTITPIPLRGLIAPLETIQSSTRHRHDHPHTSPWSHRPLGDYTVLHTPPARSPSYLSVLSSPPWRLYSPPHATGTITPIPLRALIAPLETIQSSTRHQKTFKAPFSSVARRPLCKSTNPSIHPVAAEDEIHSWSQSPSRTRRPSGLSAVAHSDHHGQHHGTWFNERLTVTTSPWRRGHGCPSSEALSPA